MPRPRNFRHRAKGKLLLLTSPFIGLGDISRVMRYFASEPALQQSLKKFLLVSLHCQPAGIRRSIGEGRSQRFVDMDVLEFNLFMRDLLRARYSDHKEPQAVLF